MIIVRLFGGLGNQMFQYAAGRRLALANGATLKVDLNWFDNVPSGATPRRYLLNVFNTADNVASSSEIKKLIGVRTEHWPRLAKRLVGAAGFLGQSSCVRERHYHFDPDILQKRGALYLDGCWQSEKYFEDIEYTIRQEFAFKVGMSKGSIDLARTVEACEAVSVHVRRGDYVSDQRTNQYHGICSLQYYEEAMQRIKTAIANPHFFVFSDEPEWAKQNVRSHMPMTFVDGHPERPYEDLWLMSLCKHHIIANSSFSWWGAWLGKAADKLVYAPAKWFANSGLDSRDLIPASWKRL